MKTGLLSLLFLLGIFSSVCKAQVSGISCSSNTFWTVSSADSAIYGFQLNGNTVTSLGKINSNMPGQSLAFSWIPNNSNYTPTFYTSTENDAFYLNGTTWVKCPGTAINDNIVNAAGSVNSLYFLDNSSRMKIYRYADTSFTNIFNSVAKCTVADISADDDGNLWGFTGLDTLGSIYTDSIDVVNPTGQLIHQFPLWLNTGNSYGTAIMNGTLYIGLGSSNPFNPNTLIPINVVDDSVVIGSPIAMQSGFFSDMASCNAGKPLAVRTVKPVNGHAVISPNPANNNLSIALPLPAAISIYNILGKQLYYNKQETSSINIDISAFANGLYLLQTNTGSGPAQQKFVVQH